MIIDATVSDYRLPSQIIKRIALEKSVDPALVASIIIAESGGRKYAAQYQPKYRHFYKVNEFAKSLGITPITERIHQATSVGLMQIMLSTARTLGFKGHYAELYDPETNIRYGTELLRRLKLQYGNVRDMAAAYNAGQARKDVHGRYYNQEYVDKIMRIKEGMDIWF